jgi:carboxy-cis,cis-muconate cyclase
MGGHRKFPLPTPHSTPILTHPTALANSATTKTRAIFVLAAQKTPYNVYGNPFYDHAGFLNVFSVDETGKLLENVQNAELEERSAIHGMVFDAEEEYLYSADMWENRVWCHRKVSSFFFSVFFLLDGSEFLWLGFS